MKEITMSKADSEHVYRGTATRQGKWWFIDIPELGTGGQARTLREIDEAAREVVAGWLDCRIDDVHVSIDVVVPASAQDSWRAAEEAEAAARRQASEAAALRRQAVAQLREAGITLTDAGTLLGVSTQRVHQLTRP
jgi:hypothetical protein